MAVHGGSTALRVETTEIEATRPLVWVRGTPSASAAYESQLLCGERFRITSVDGGWAAGTCAHDGYPGFVELEDFDDASADPTHAVAVRIAPVLPEPFLRTHPVTFLALGSGVRIDGAKEQFLHWERGGWLYRVHLVPWPLPALRLSAAVARLAGVPYVWAGRTCFGMDCSGFVQAALGHAGHAVPRDLGEQAAFPGTVAVAVDERRPGDLVLCSRAGGYFHGGLVVDDDWVAHTGRRFAAVDSEPFDRFVRTFELDSSLEPERAVTVSLVRLPPVTRQGVDAR
jgi:hypothetical protein